MRTIMDLDKSKKQNTSGKKDKGNYNRMTIDVKSGECSKLPQQKCRVVKIPGESRRTFISYIFESPRRRSLSKRTRPLGKEK